MGHISNRCISVRGARGVDLSWPGSQPVLSIRHSASRPLSRLAGNTPPRRSAMCSVRSHAGVSLVPVRRILLLVALLLIAASPTSSTRAASHSVGCLSLTNWTMAVTSLTVTPGFNMDRPLPLLAPDCELVTLANSCHDPTAPCWDTAIGVDLHTGQLTFNLTLPTLGQHERYADLYTNPVLSFDGQLVYWSRLVSNSSSSFPSSAPPSSTPCAEVLAFTHGPASVGGQLRWRSEMCGVNLLSTSRAQLLVFSGLYGNGTDDVLLQQELGLGTHPDLHWRSLRGSTGQVLYEELAAFPLSVPDDTWLSSYKRDNSGVFSIAIADQPSWACNISADGRWQVVRNYTTEENGHWADFTDNGAFILQREVDVPNFTTLRSVELLTGRALWTESVNSSILHDSWVPAIYDWAVIETVFQDSSDGQPELAVLQSETMLLYTKPPLYVAVNGFINQRTAECYTTDVLQPPFEAAPVPGGGTIVNWWLDGHTVASWKEWRWFVYVWPDMHVLAYGDVDLRVEYGDGPDELARFGLSQPHIVGFDPSGPAVLTVYSFVDRIVAKTFTGNNYSVLSFSASSSSSSSSTAASPHASSSSSSSQPLLSSTGDSSASGSSWTLWGVNGVIVVCRRVGGTGLAAFGVAGLQARPRSSSATGLGEPATVVVGAAKEMHCRSMMTAGEALD